MNETFLSMIHENRKYNGANELLEILSSFISGFAVPLREEHVGFFKNIIIPLHKVHYSHMFHDQLQRCSGMYIGKDTSLTEALIQGILRYWPYGNSPKEMLFLDELNGVLEFYDINKLDDIAPQILRRIFICMSSPQLQVSDRAVSFFEKEYFLAIIKNFKQIAFPLFVPSVVELSETHWFKILQESFASVRLILKEIDTALFDKVINDKENKTYNALIYMHNSPMRAEREHKWEVLISEAKRIEPGFVVPQVPYTDSHVVGLNNKII
jgi:serine/threonine-protein phosphatase 2A regulatory subunit B'